MEGWEEGQESPVAHSCGHLSLLGAQSKRRCETRQVFFFFSIFTEKTTMCPLALFISFPSFYKGTFSSFLFALVLFLEHFCLLNAKDWIYLTELGKSLL